MDIKDVQSWERKPEVEAFDEITEEEIISLWNCFQAGGLSGYEAWHAILTGIALDMAFAQGKDRTRIDQ
jgi:hypothetical protein